MAIIIVDNFQVDINNPIDNRFVVGSQSIPSGGTYPTPFYAYKEDIIYRYPGLRIWDFNDNVPYVWDGTQWINENTTGALVQDAATGYTGFQNYVTKFANNQTLLTASSIYDSGTHVGVGLNDNANPNDTDGTIGPYNPGQISPVGLSGFHVAGNIKTNAYFVGKVHANWIRSGSLDLERITPPGTSQGLRVLKNTTGDNSGTSWDLLSNIVPTSAGNLIATTIPNSTVGYVYGGLVSSQYTFKPLISTGLQITDGSNDIRIESKAGINLGAPIDGETIYAGLDTDNIHQFKRIKSSSLQVLTDPSNNSITVEVPATFEGTDYYVNNNYTGTEQLGTRSKPFRDLKACINKILNRTSNSGPTSYTGGFIGGVFANGVNPERPGQMNVTPDTFTASINGGQAYRKWEIRTGPNQPKPTYSNNYYSSLPGNGAVRVIIQSYCEIDENLAINGVTYLLEKQGVSNIVVISDYYNDPGTPEDGQPFKYLFDMTPLAGTADANPAGTALTGVPKGNPIIWTGSQLISVSRPFQMDYGLNCTLEGSGSIGFSSNHTKRKGFFRSKGINSFDLSTAAKLINPLVQVVNGPNNRVDENDCNLFIGSEAGYIYCNMDRIPLGYESETPHITHTGYLYDADMNQIAREGVTMSGYQTTAVPDYGAIQVEGRNLMFGESLFLAGTLQINCFEQHMVYVKDYGAMYSESGRIYMRRHYQKVLYSNAEFVPFSTEQDPVGGIYGDNWYKITSVSATGTLYTNWRNSDFFVQTSWRDSNGAPIPQPTYPLGSSAWVGLSVKTTTSYQSPQLPATGVYYNPNGSTNVNYPTSGSLTYTGTHKGRMVRVRKFYRPCNHVYDIYLKNGAQWNHGGDFYTQQNTGAIQGGACAFLGIENNIIKAGDATHPAYSFGQSTTGCAFRANGGGFVTNLFYNYHIKYILDESYLADRYAYKHDINFKSLKIDSNVFNSVIGVFKTSGANPANNYLTNANTILGTSSQSWTQSIFIGSFTNCYLYDVAPYSELRTPFSNLTINNGIQGAVSGPGLINVDGGWFGMMSISGTSIELSSGSINTSIPLFNGNTDAISRGYPVGGIYLDYDTTNLGGDSEPILKVVKNL